MRQDIADPDLESGTSAPSTDPVREPEPERDEPLPRRSRKQRLRTPLLLLGPVVLGLAVAWVYYSGGTVVDTENAYVKTDKVQIPSQVSGLLVQVDVAENQHVEAGDPLFRVDDTTYRLAAEQARANLAEVRSEIAELKAGYRLAQRQLDLARTDAAFAQREYERLSGLAATKSISPSTLDSAAHDRDAARQKVDVAEADLARLVAGLGGNPDIAVDDHPRVRQARSAVERADLDLARTTVRAPFAGVASNTPDVGQQVIGEAPFPSPVMALIADHGARIEANFKETDLTHVKPGQSVRIVVDAFPDRVLHGHVQSIAQATGAEFSVLPPENATGNWVKVVQRIPVRISIDDTDLPPLRSGMSATVSVDTGFHRALPGFLSSLDGVMGLGTPPAAAHG